MGFWEIFLWIPLAWALMGLMWWPMSLIVRKILGIKTIWGHKLNLIDCVLNGPMTGLYTLIAHCSPEYADVFNKE